MIKPSLIYVLFPYLFEVALSQLKAKLANFTSIKNFHLHGKWNSEGTDENPSDNAVLVLR